MILSNGKRFLVAVLSIILSFIMVSVFFSCGRRVTDRSTGTDPLTPRTNDRNDRDDDDIISTRKGGGSCEGNQDCEEMCDDLFNARREMEDCIELTANEVEGMYDAFEEDDGLLANPDEDDIGDVHSDDIRNALRIDDNIWSDLIDEYSSREAGHVLLWIAEEEDVFDALSVLDNDDEEKLIKELMDEFKGSVTSAMVGNLDDDDDDVFSVLAEHNEDAVELVHDLLTESCISDSDKSSGDAAYTLNGREILVKITNREQACVLGEVYCKKDDGDYVFDDDLLEMLVDFDDDLEGYIEDENGLGVDDNNVDDIEEVCSTFCGVFCRGNPTPNETPSQCNCS